MMRKITIIIALILIASIVLSITKNVVAKTALSAGMKAITGLKLSMRSMNVGIFKTLIDIKELKLFNPARFPDKLMVDVPEIHVDYNLLAFLKRKVHLEKVKLNLREFVVVKNKDGELNLDSLKVVKEKKDKTPAKGKSPEVQIDIMELKIGKVIYKDYSKGTLPEIKEFNVNINEQYKDISDLRTFSNLILYKALINTNISKLANFDLGPIKDGLGKTLGKATKIAQQTTEKAIEVGKEIGTKAQEVTKEATEKVGESLKKVFSFGDY